MLHAELKPGWNQTWPESRHRVQPFWTHLVHSTRRSADDRAFTEHHQTVSLPACQPLERCGRLSLSQTLQTRIAPESKNQPPLHLHLHHRETNHQNSISSPPSTGTALHPWGSRPGHPILQSPPTHDQHGLARRHGAPDQRRRIAVAPRLARLRQFLHQAEARTQRRHRPQSQRPRAAKGSRQWRARVSGRQIAGPRFLPCAAKVCAVLSPTPSGTAAQVGIGCSISPAAACICICIPPSPASC